MIARVFEADLSAPVVAAGTRIQNVRQISERVAMGRALWRELVVGFASQLGELNLGFTQLAALYVLAEGATTTIADLAEAIGRSPSATSRLVDGLVKRRLVERRREEDDGRQRSVWLTARGRAILRIVDRARAEQFLTAVRPLPRGERALIAMGVAALATGAISRRTPGARRASRRAADRGPGPSAALDLDAPRTARRIVQQRSAARPGRSWACEVFSLRGVGDVARARRRRGRGPRRRLTRRAGAASAAVAQHHVVEDGQAPAQRVQPTRSSTPWNRSRNRSSGSRRSGEKP